MLTKHLLLESLPEAERLRKIAAILTVLEMYRQEGERILQEELPKIVLHVLPCTTRSFTRLPSEDSFCLVRSGESGKG